MPICSNSRKDCSGNIGLRCKITLIVRLKSDYRLSFKLVILNSWENVARTVSKSLTCIFWEFLIPGRDILAVRYACFFC